MPRPSRFTKQSILELRQRLVDGEAIHCPLPELGRIYMRSPVPVLPIYYPSALVDEDAAAIATGLSSYLILSKAYSAKALTRFLGLLPTLVGESAARILVMYLQVVEMPPGVGGPQLQCPRTEWGATVSEAMQVALSQCRLFGEAIEAKQVWTPIPPPSKPMAITFHIPYAWWREAGHVGGLRPVLRVVSRTLREGFYAFLKASDGDKHPPSLVLGRHSFVSTVRAVDRRISEIDARIEFLRLMTPRNVDAAWQRFGTDRYERPPQFKYRRLGWQPDLLRRKLYAIRVERIEDPLLRDLYREKREELARQINLLAGRRKQRNLYDSLALYGPVDAQLLAEAREISSAHPGGGRPVRKGAIHAEQLAHFVRDEIDLYRQHAKQFSPGVQLDEDLGGGVMVSSGTLLIGRSARVSRKRLQALLQHEVGTHLVTHFNGARQPLGILAAGLAGYDELQEGLAVLAEYCVSRLPVSRLWQLAMRVIAVASVIDGASFIDTFRLLREEGMSPNNAFTTSMRVHRGNGLTKDAVYLRGLRRILDHLAKGGGLAPLYLGKMSFDHIPVILELQRQGTLYPPCLLPSFLEQPRAQARLKRLRQSATPLLSLTR